MLIHELTEIPLWLMSVAVFFLLLCYRGKQIALPLPVIIVRNEASVPPALTCWRYCILVALHILRMPQKRK